MPPRNEPLPEPVPSARPGVAPRWREPARRFTHGLILGMAAAGILLAWPVDPVRVASLEWARGWVLTNLGGSVVAFGLDLALFLASLGLLRRRLAQGAPPAAVAQADQLSELWISLFFGIGVLWTAIGMRAALLQALGSGAAAVEAEGAAGILDRLVQGGILTALTTTIVGGAGGYLLRVYKTVRVGGALRDYYAALDAQQGQRVERLLRDIRERLPERRERAPCS